MSSYIARRLLLAFVTLVGVSMATFLVVRLIPGDVVDQIADTSLGNERGKEELRKQFGLSDSIPRQYAEWIGGVVRGDFGREIISNRPIGSELAQRLPRTVELGLIAIVIGVFVALPIGVVAAIRQDSPLDLVVRSSAVLFLATPAFWLATLAVVLPSKYLNWAPPPVYRAVWDNPGQNLQLVLLPALILGLASTGSLMRITRTQMLEVLRQDYIRTAWAKGLREQSVVTRHALRNSLIPVVTVIGLQLPTLVAGAVIMETIFGIPGVGSYFLQAISFRDYPTVQVVNLVVATVVVLSNLLVDISYAYLDPRIRYR